MKPSFDAVIHAQPPLSILCIVAASLAGVVQGGGLAGGPVLDSPVIANE